jgi:hypothetical protein
VSSLVDMWVDRRHTLKTLYTRNLLLIMFSPGTCESFFINFWEITQLVAISELLNLY